MYFLLPKSCFTDTILPHFFKYMEKSVLKAQVRDKKVKASKLRRQSLIPAEFYGHGVDNLTLQMDYQTFRKLYREVGDNTVIDLEVDGVGNKKVLVHRVDYHPVSDAYQYVEFINVRMDEEVTTRLPIRLEGQAPAVRDLAGVLVQSLDEVEVRCLPGDLIHELVLSVESLVDFNHSLRVSDLQVPAKITVLTEADTMIAVVAPPAAEEEETPAEEQRDVTDVEVTSEKKEGEEGEGGKKEE